MYLLVVVGGFGTTAYMLFRNAPKCTIEAHRETSFVVNKPYQDVTKALITSKVMDCVLQANGAYLLDQQWADKKFAVQRPLSAKHRTWQFGGVATARVMIRDPDAGETVVQLVQEVDASQDRIKIRTILDKPLAVGITDMQQRILIERHGENQTKVSFQLYMKLQRHVPSFAREYANKRVQQAADKQIMVFEPVFTKCVSQPSKGWMSLIPALNDVQGKVQPRPENRRRQLRRSPSVYLEF